MLKQSKTDKNTSKALFKRILPVFMVIIMLIGFASCGGGSEKLQETTVITKNVSQKWSAEIFFDNAIGFVKGGTRFFVDNEPVKNPTDFGYSYDGYNLDNVPPSVISMDKYVFYLNEERELHRINTQTNADEIIIEMQTNAENIIYSDSYMIIYGTQDGYNYEHYLYDVKKEKFVENELVKDVCSNSQNTKFACLLGEKLYYIDNAQYASTESVLKCCNLADNSISDVYKSASEKTENYYDLETGEYVVGDGEDIEEYISGAVACDPENNYLYYRVDYNYFDKEADGRKYGWKIFKYDSETGKNDEQYNELTMDYTKADINLPKTLSGVFAANGKLYGYLQADPGIDGGSFFVIENGDINKTVNLPAGEKLYVDDKFAYYKSDDKNILVSKDKVLSVDETLNETAGFLGCFNNEFWYSTENGLSVLNEESLQTQEKVMFNGFIISAVGDYFVCYGKPIEKQDITGPFGEKSTVFTEGDEGLYKVSINETEQEEIVRDVFLVSDKDKSKAVSILDETYGLEIMTLVSSPVITANDTTYEEGVVSVTVSGKFRMAEDLWVERTTVFTVNLADETCGTSELWDIIVSAYNNGI